MDSVEIKLGFINSSRSRPRPPNLTGTAAKDCFPSPNLRPRVPPPLAHPRPRRRCRRRRAPPIQGSAGVRRVARLLDLGVARAASRRLGGAQGAKDHASVPI